MVRSRLASAATLILAMPLIAPSSAMARSEEGTIQAAHEVLAEFVNLRERQIPASLLSEAHGVAIIPSVIKVGFVVGGQHGRGVLMTRQADGSWRGPMFVTLTGGSVGWQIGAQATDFVLVFKTQKGVEGLQRGKFTLGADASVAAGPLGRRAEAATDAELKAEIYSYSRNRGLFAGVALDGSALQIDETANASYYGTIPPGGTAPQPPASALKLVETIARLTANPNAGVGAPGATLDLSPTPAARPSSQADALQAELSGAVAKLNPLLDDNWRRYLALPGEAYQPGRHPSAEALSPALQRFDALSRDPQYRTLSERPEFQAVHRLLRAYQESLSPISASPKLALPPPPTGERR